MTAHTLTAPARHLLEVKHSKFLAQATSVDSSDAALAWLQQAADPAATHNCWAYRVGADYRSSDDGEPAGTAGRPILAAIDGQGYDQVMVVVTRWYGGVKLGAGGLVRAYGGVAAQCLRAAARRQIVALTDTWLRFEFDDTGVVHDLLSRAGAEKLEEHFQPNGVRMHIRLPCSRLVPLQQHIRDATRGKADFGDNG